MYIYRVNPLRVNPPTDSPAINLRVDPTYGSEQINSGAAVRMHRRLRARRQRGTPPIKKGLISQVILCSKSG